MVYLRFVFTLHLNGFLVFSSCWNTFSFVFFFLVFLLVYNNRAVLCDALLTFSAVFFCLFSICSLDAWILFSFLLLLFCCMKLLFYIIHHLKINNFRVYFFFIYALINKSFLVYSLLLLFIPYLKNLPRPFRELFHLFLCARTHTHT